MYILVILLCLIMLVIILTQIKVKNNFKKKMPIPINYEIGIPYEEVYFKALDTVNLYGVLTLPKNPKAIIICVHGFAASHHKYLAVIEKLFNENYACFAIDLRAHNKSDGKYIACSYLEDRDVHGAINYIKKKNETKDLPIIFMGHSMGGATVMSSYVDGIKGIINIAGLADFEEVSSLNLVKKFPKFLKPYFKFNIKLYILLTYGFKRYEKALSKSKNIECPILILHDYGDDKVPYSESLKYMKALHDKDIKLISYENNNHNPLLVSYKAGIVNDKAINDVLSFLNKVL